MRKLLVWSEVGPRLKICPQEQLGEQKGHTIIPSLYRKQGLKACSCEQSKLKIGVHHSERRNVCV
jgi:hypothetical protein